VTAQSFSNLTLTANSVIDFSSLSGASAITFTGAGNGLGGFHLSIWDYVAGNSTTQIFFSLGSGGSGLTSGDLSNISFYSGAGTGLLGTAAAFSGNQIVAVPEPAVVLTGMLLLGWLMVSYRSRKTSDSKF
jgi:hypothetical protein